MKNLKRGVSRAMGVQRKVVYPQFTVRILLGVLQDGVRRSASRKFDVTLRNDEECQAFDRTKRTKLAPIRESKVKRCFLCDFEC